MQVVIPYNRVIGWCDVEPDGPPNVAVVVAHTPTLFQRIVFEKRIFNNQIVLAALNEKEAKHIPGFKPIAEATHS